MDFNKFGSGKLPEKKTDNGKANKALQKRAERILKGPINLYNQSLWNLLFWGIRSIFI